MSYFQLSFDYNLISSLKDPNAHDEDFNIDVDESARVYRVHFLGYEHYNFYGTDDQQVKQILILY
jgi:hypothetical protein